MQFGMTAPFVIDRKLGRQIPKEEACAILKKSEEAGLVHASINRQDIDFPEKTLPRKNMSPKKH
jgi:hypothetical protein